MPAATVRIWNIHVTMHMVNFLSGEAVHITIMQRVAIPLPEGSAAYQTS